MVKNIEQKFAPDLAVLINSSCFLRRQDSSYFNGQTGEIGVLQLQGAKSGYYQQAPPINRKSFIIKKEHILGI